MISSEARRISTVLATAGIHVGKQFQVKREALAERLAESPHADLIDSRSMLLLAREGRARGYTAVPVWILSVLEDADWPSVISGLRRDRAPVQTEAERRAAEQAREARAAEVEGVSLEEWRELERARLLAIAVFDDGRPAVATAAQIAGDETAGRALLDRATLQRWPELACGTKNPADGAYARWTAREAAASEERLERWRASRERHAAASRTAAPEPAHTGKQEPKREISGGKRRRRS